MAPGAPFPSCLAPIPTLLPPCSRRPAMGPRRRIAAVPNQQQQPRSFPTPTLPRPPPLATKPATNQMRTTRLFPSFFSCIFFLVLSTISLSLVCGSKRTRKPASSQALLRPPPPLRARSNLSSPSTGAAGKQPWHHDRPDLPCRPPPRDLLRRDPSGADHSRCPPASPAR